MGTSRFLRGVLCACALLCLALGAEAQGKRGRGGKRGGPPAGAGKPPGNGAAPFVIPGFEAPAGGQGKKPAGPKGKKPGTPAKGKAGAGAKKPAAPPDPMTEADRVAQEAEARARLESVDDKRLKELFALCDLDQNGWISLREAELVLSFDRAEYRRADADQDGRLVPREYSAQKTLVFARLGAPPETKPAPEPVREPSAPAATPAKAVKPPAREKGSLRSGLALPGVFPRPTDLLQRYDRDASKGLGSEEVARLLVDLGLDFSAPLVVAQMDPDKDGELGPIELLPLSLLASRHMPEELKPGTKKEAPIAAEKPAAQSGEQERPRISALAAMTPFGRLDRDRDGFVGEADLQAMQGLARTDARLGALLSALDADGDRKLSRAEFERAMGGPASDGD